MSALKNNGVLYQLTGRAQELSRQTKEKLEHSSALIVFSALLKIVPNAGNDDLSLEQKSPERKSPERKSPERMESQQSLELTPRSDDPADDDDDAFEDEDARERVSNKEHVGAVRSNSLHGHDNVLHFLFDRNPIRLKFHLYCLLC